MSRMTSLCKWLLVPTAIFDLLLFCFISRYRLIDGDEGFYLLASKLVFRHQILYRDFLYTQMPLLPYVYGTWMKVVASSWYSARFLSALLTTLLAVSIYIHTTRETGKWFSGVLATLLFALNSSALVWFCIVKTFATADLLVFLAYMLATRSSRNSPRWALVAVGLLIGLSVDTRLYYAALIPVFLGWYWACHDGPRKTQATILFSAGVVAAILPNVHWFVLAPRAYIFNNIGYHSIRSGFGLIGNIDQKLTVAVRVLLSGGPEGNGIQTLLLVLLALVCIALLRRQPNTVWFSYGIAGVLFAVSLLPTPTLFSYFSVVVPFVVTGVTISLSSTWDSLESRQRQVPAAALLLMFFGVAYLLPGRRDVHNYVGMGEGVPGIESWKRAPDYRIEAVREVSRAIDQIARPQESVLSFWPGYLVESRANPVPTTANNFGYYVADDLSESDRKRYRVMSMQQLREGLRSHHIRVAVIGNQDALSQDPVFGSASMSTFLSQNGYREARRIGATTIYVDESAGNIRR
jgi:hypothetical protein